MNQVLTLDQKKFLAVMREQSGIFLAEMLVALLCSSILAAALIGNISETYRLSTSGQNQVLASAMAQEVIDNTRNTSYTTLASYIGTPYTLVVHKESASTVFPAIYPRQLMMNMSDMVWTQQAQDNKFVPTVTETVTAGPLANTVRVTVDISWFENGQGRTYSMSTIISENGIHN